MEPFCYENNGDQEKTRSMIFSVFVVKIIANVSGRFFFLILEELEGFGL